MPCWSILLSYCIIFMHKLLSWNLYLRYRLIYMHKLLCWLWFSFFFYRMYSMYTRLFFPPHIAMFDVPPWALYIQPILHSLCTVP